MKTLTNAELIEIQGGDWDWGDFFRGASVGLGLVAVDIMTAGAAAPLEAAAAVAWTGAGLSVISLLLN